MTRADYWDWENQVNMSGALHQCTYVDSGSPRQVRGRPIGFHANIDQKPVYRVPAGSRPCVSAT